MNNPKGQYMVEEAHPIDVHHEHAKAITVRSGRVVNNKVEELRSNESKPIVGVMNSRDKAVKASKGDHVPSSSTSSPILVAPYVPKAPFPQCLDVPSLFGKKGVSMKDIVEVFK